MPPFEGMSERGHQFFADELARFAGEIDDPALSEIARRIAAPLRVAVHGRRGVGVSTVAWALVGAGVHVTASQADVEVYVVAEALKPEDRDAIAAAQHPVVGVLTKADLIGPSAAGRAHCAHLFELTGVAVEPMLGLLAVAATELDDTLWAALQLLAAHTADLSSADAFVAVPHRLPRAERQRLLEALDMFGIRLAIAAARQGRSRAQVRALLRRASCVDVVVDRISAAGAEMRYRRILDALDELQAMAVSDPRISGFLSRDDTVIARMGAAVDVVEAAGLRVDPRDGQADHLRRAVTWRRYSRGPVSAVHRSCGADIARGSLRLWSQAGGAP
jgi:energy-coupling factor transporter ATP-binding protein EcfA2